VYYNVYKTKVVWKCKPKVPRVLHSISLYSDGRMYSRTYDRGIYKYKSFTVQAGVTSVKATLKVGQTAGLDDYCVAGWRTGHLHAYVNGREQFRLGGGFVDVSRSFSVKGGDVVKMKFGGPVLCGVSMWGYLREQ